MSRDLSELVKNDYRGGLNPHELDWLVPAIERVEADAKSLRAYRDKTEAALLGYSFLVQKAIDGCQSMIRKAAENGTKGTMWHGYLVEDEMRRDNLKELGLWREPPKDGGS